MNVFFLIFFFFYLIYEYDRDFLEIRPVPESHCCYVKKISKPIMLFSFVYGIPASAKYVSCKLYDVVPYKLIFLYFVAKLSQCCASDTDKKKNANINHLDGLLHLSLVWLPNILMFLQISFSHTRTWNISTIGTSTGHSQ